MSKERYKSLYRLPMMTPESRDKLDSTLTPKLPSLLQETKVRRENSFGVCYK